MMIVSVELSKFITGSTEYNFFDKVFSELAPNFVRMSVENRLRETHNNLNEAKQRYFKWHIVANAVIKSAEQLEKSESTATSSPNSGEVYSKKDIHHLYLNVVRKYLPDKDSKLGPFGLCQENALKVDKNTRLKGKTLMFKNYVEENLKDFCIKIIQYTGDNVIPDSFWENAFDRVMKRLQLKVVHQFAEETGEQSKKLLREMVNTYTKELSEGMSMMSKLLSLHEQNLQFESDLAEFYLHRCQAISLKVKNFEFKIIGATYNHETLLALKKISSQLDQSEHKLKEEENEKTVAVEQYLKLGKEYQNFVDEYTRLTKSIKEQKWSIDELKCRKSQYEASDHV